MPSNNAFQPTPSHCALGFPRPLRGLGAAERGRESASTVTTCPHCNRLTIGFWARWWSDSACPVRCPNCGGWSYISDGSEMGINAVLRVLPLTGAIATVVSNSIWPFVAALLLTPVAFWYLVHTSGAVPLSDAQATQNRRWGNVVMYSILGALVVAAVVTKFAYAL